MDDTVVAIAVVFIVGLLLVLTSGIVGTLCYRSHRQTRCEREEPEEEPRASIAAPPEVWVGIQILP